jgi:ABC-2 type transport system ATP-binding protein
MDHWALTTHALAKSYGTVTAVVDLSFSVRRGEVFGFLGPNGAGKTTSMNMLVALVSPSSGDGSVLGRPLGDRQVRSRIGLLPEHFRFHETLTGRELLTLHGLLHGMNRRERRSQADRLLLRVGLIDAADRQLREYSKGMTQRLGLAQALINRPELVFLDEPTSGLDPLGRLMVRDLIRDLREEGTTVFLNSHLLGEVEQVCDRVAFVKQGRIVREVYLSRTLSILQVEMRIDRDAGLLVAELMRFGRVVSTNGHHATMEIPSEAVIPDLVRWLSSQSIGLYSLQPKQASLETLFVETMGSTEGTG